MAGETIYGGSVDRKVYAVDLASGAAALVLPPGRTHRWRRAACWAIPCTRPARAPRAESTPLDAQHRASRLWRTTTGTVSAPLALVGRHCWWPRRSAARSFGAGSGGRERCAGAGWSGSPGSRRSPATAARSWWPPSTRCSALDRRATAGWFAAPGRRERSCRPGSGTAACSWAGRRDSASGRDRPGRPPASLAVPRSTLRCSGRPAAQGDTIYAASRRGTRLPDHARRARHGAGGHADRGARLAGDRPGDGAGRPRPAGRRRRHAPGPPTRRHRGLAHPALARRPSSARCRSTTVCSPSAATATSTGTADDARFAVLVLALLVTGAHPPPGRRGTSPAHQVRQVGAGRGGGRDELPGRTGPTTGRTTSFDALRVPLLRRP